jgi:hypothetical protein
MSFDEKKLRDALQGIEKRGRTMSISDVICTCGATPEREDE